jgi:hypothetical protein
MYVGLGTVRKYNLKVLYRKESNLVISSSPVIKIMYSYYWA